MNEQSNRKNELADILINSSKNTLCGELKPLYRGISSFKHKETASGKIFTDGNYFYYSPEKILTEFKSNPNSINRIFLHSLFHCVFLHLFNTDFKNRDLWNIACDICVEKAINDCNLSCTAVKKTKKEQVLISKLSGHIKSFTAENIYFYFCNSDFSAQELSEYTQAFCVDCHSVWYENRFFNKFDENEDVTETEARSIYKIADDRDGDYQKNKRQVKDDTVKSRTQKSEEWKEITKRIIRDSDAASSAFGISQGFDTLMLKAVTRDKCDYSEFLKKFIQTSEQLEINDDEFDYIYYTYGLNLYGNIPLIEPLEYSENTKINRLIIAIDTSGSVYGKLVENFVNKTYSLLKATDFFKKDCEIHLIQCDCKIQAVNVFHSQDELEKHLSRIILSGFGGTDFRPVFEYANRLLEQDKNKTFNGVIYLTDGDGIYPDNMPGYKNAFIITDNGFNKNKLPAWATPVYVDINEFSK
ncbi:MAG: hypothetical protein J6D06_02670 [Clostridia bacterium]|nr:hypothetical protein [Clostridia bacterium]